MFEGTIQGQTLEMLERARVLGEAKFHQLFTQDLRVESLGDGQRVVSTYRMQAQQDGPPIPVWRVVHKSGEPDDGQSSVHEPLTMHRQSSDHVSAPWYVRPANFDEQCDLTLAWKLLSNRRYFEHCRCCGILHHVDRMMDHVCDICVQDPLPQKEWNDQSLIYAFIKPITREVMLEDAFIHAPHLHNLQMQSLVKPDQVLGLMIGELTWDRPHEPSTHWKVIKRFSPPLALNDEMALHREQYTLLSNRRFFKACHRCAARRHKDHMSGDTCFSCAERFLSVVH